MRRLFCVWTIVVVSAMPAYLAAQEGDTEDSVSQEGASPVQLRALEADVTPVLDVTLPSGSVAVESLIMFSNLELLARTDYDFLDNSIGARAAFSYPLGLILPELIFFDAVDFERTVQPRPTADGLSLTPSERYVSRNRGVESRIWYFLLPEWRGGPSFIVSERFRGTLTEGGTIEDEIYYAASLSTAVDTITTEDLDTATFSGWELASSLDWNFRGTVREPASIDHVTTMGVYASLRNEPAVEPRVTVAYPIEVW